MAAAPPQLAGELAGGDGKTVVVGVKMDAESRELLTWSLVKVAHPGDLVIALHVLASNEIVDRDGKSSLLSLVKAFDSVLAVYEGFCNLKQVDLKLKICRGSSIRKVIVREANSYAASSAIVGTATKHTIRSSTSVAKYCARKLPKDCSVLAVRNGKVVFRREASLSSAKKANDSKGIHDYQENNISVAFQKSVITNLRLNDGDSNTSPKIGDSLEHKMLEADAGQREAVLKRNCTICCSPDTIPSSSSRPCTNIRDDQGGKDDQDNSMALVPLEKLEASSSLISLLVKELPELRPGWPLLRRTLLCARQDSGESPSDSGVSSLHDVSGVQWAMLLPNKPDLSAADNGQQADGGFCDPEGQHDAIVPVAETTSHQTSLEKESRSPPRDIGGLHEKYSSACRLFEYEELQSATSNFSPDNLIGAGGNSQVYRGSLRDGKELAVKILKPSEDAYEEFVMEIEIITSLHHKNIIALFGFCFEDNNLLLIYDLLPRGSLEENLHGSKKDPVAFGWNERYRVALGVAEALHYLHNHSITPVIHRDVKSSNILLSEDFEPQLSDFGLAKRASTSSHITCTDVAGTFGYMAPEYFMYGKVTDKIDVYAFGVVLLELLSGRKPISSEQPKGQESLVMWAKPILNGGKVSKLLDPCMGSDYDRDHIERMVLAATLCIRRAPRARPQMSLILKLLQGDAEVLRWARLQVNALENNVDGLDDDEGLPQPDLQSHLNLALLDIEDDSLSVSSVEQHISLEEYLRGRWSRSSSFD